MTGTWIGATRDESAIHVWRVVQRGESAFIYATVNDSGVEQYYSARVTAEAILINGSPHAAATCVDADHFALADWHDGQTMVFSRAGLAELTTASIWARVP